MSLIYLDGNVSFSSSGTACVLIARLAYDLRFFVYGGHSVFQCARFPPQTAVDLPGVERVRDRHWCQ